MFGRIAAGIVIGGSSIEPDGKGSCWFRSLSIVAGAVIIGKIGELKGIPGGSKRFLREFLRGRCVLILSAAEEGCDDAWN
jgi:hypothetical protein